MRATDAARELLYPLTDAGIVLAMLVFWLLGSLAFAAGLLGLWLLIVVVPAYFRYALHLLEARARDQTPPVPGIEMFNLVGNSWSLLPLLVLSASIWLLILLDNRLSSVAAILAGLVLMLLLPATMGILGMTYSPLTSLSPVAIVNLIRSLGVAYFRVPVTLTAVVVTTLFAHRFGMPGPFVDLLLIYAFFLMCTMTGALLHTNQIQQQIDIPDAPEPAEEEIQQGTIKARQKVANHAYSFFSRGNRAGGLQHIETWLRDEDSCDEAWAWFFAEMLKWENRDHALFFAQVYLGRLLRERRELDVQKVLSRCLLENGRFRPAEEDRDATLELLRRHERDDILQQLQR